MSERRAHWTDELIETVRHRIQGFGYDALDEITHGAIAAVEDWHKAKRDSRDRTHSDECWRWHQECAEALIEAQQAALRRVRELIDTADRFTPPLVLTSAELRRALDVPCPTCSGPIRETVGLVCQTCGTDYGASDE